MSFSMIRPWMVFAFLPVAACGATTTEEGLDTAAQEVRIDVGRRSVAYEYAHPDSFLPGGVAGGEDVVFVGSPLDGRVLVLNRIGGKQIAEVPQPPGHFILPLIMHSIGPSRVAILDCGGFPEPGITDVTPTIYEYEYTLADGAFTATLARTVTFAGQRIGFAEEFVYLGSGQYLVPDAVYGSIWRVASDGSVHAGIVPRSFAPADAFPEMVYCPTMPQITVGGLPFLFTGSTIPGVASIAVRAGSVYFYSSCAGGLYRFPFAALFDARQPWERASDIRLIARKPAGIAVEQLLEMQFNAFDPTDDHLYAADSLQLRIIRIDPKNGRREVIADDPTLFNFPAALEFLPPILGEQSPMVVLSNQQHRSPLLNGAITEDLTQPPYIVAKVFVFPR